MGKWLYVPAADDGTVNNLASCFKSDYGCIEVVPGSHGLAQLHTDPDESHLYIFGHGNSGAGIGTKGTHFTAKQLAEKLVRDGLSPQQTGLTIHLVACSTGASSSKWSGSRLPYVERFAEDLAGLEFSNTCVIGFAGFIKLSASTEKFGVSTRYTGDVLDEPAAGATLANPDYHVAFLVQFGKHQKVWGGNFELRKSGANGEVAAKS